jgi:hypothetical protein
VVNGTTFDPDLFFVQITCTNLSFQPFQIEDGVHEFFLHVLGPLQRGQVRAIQRGAVLQLSRATPLMQGVPLLASWVELK